MKEIIEAFKLLFEVVEPHSDLKNYDVILRIVIATKLGENWSFIFLR